MSERVLRATLYFSFFYNMFGAATFFLPADFGRSAGLPINVPFLHTAFLANNILLFGFVSLWLARQRKIDVPLLVVFGISKITFCAIMLISYLKGEIALMGFWGSCVDLVMGLIFLQSARMLDDKSASH